MSPGSRPRPSLSVDDLVDSLALDACVAGVSAPAFVERYRTMQTRSYVACVAGVSAPAFVERSVRWLRHSAARCVAGVSAPAFVERP